MRKMSGERSCWRLSGAWISVSLWIVVDWTEKEVKREKEGEKEKEKEKKKGRKENEKDLNDIWVWDLLIAGSYALQI